MEIFEGIDSAIWVAIISFIGVIIVALITKGRKPKIEPPPQLSPITPPDDDFIGREEELQELLDKIQSGNRIFGIHGMGGIGKTQLAYKLAETLKPQFPVQIYLNLKGVPEEDQIPLRPEEALADIIRVFNPEEKLPGNVDNLRAIFLSILEENKAILLMDNALDENQTKPLIPPQGSLLVVTSRKKFYLSDIHFLELKTLPPEKSIELLLNISDRIDGHAKQIAELCGHLPLALNVAGKAIAEHPDLSLGDYIEELKKNEALEPVDRSIVASCQWLAEAERNFFYRLGVFPGSFDWRAAGAVWELDEGEAKKTLRNFLNISLVEWDKETKRYHLHDLIRVYACKKVEDKKYYATQKRHAEYYLKILEETNTLYWKGGKDLLAGLHLFDLEWENIKTGQVWASEHSEIDQTAAKICDSYPNAGTFIFQIRQHPLERIKWRKDALAASIKLKIRKHESCHLTNMAEAYNELEEPQKAIEVSEQALKIFREIGDLKSEGPVLVNFGRAYETLMDYQKAIEWNKGALKIYQEMGFKNEQGGIFGNLGRIYRKLGDYENAIVNSKKELKVSRESGELRGEAHALWNMCVTLDELGDRASAIARAKEALKIYQAIRHTKGENIIKELLDEWGEEV